MDLSHYRKRAGLTLREVAEQMGVSTVAVYKMERAGNPKVFALRSYARAVGARPEEILRNLTESLISA